MNTDSKCAGIKRVSKKYKETNPKDMLEKVDYCFIGKIKKRTINNVRRFFIMIFSN